MSWGSQRRAAKTVIEELPDRLGKIQTSVLTALLDYGAYPSGWQWVNHSTTVRVLESLVKRGLVMRYEFPAIDYRGRRLAGSCTEYRAAEPLREANDRYRSLYLKAERASRTTQKEKTNG